MGKKIVFGDLELPMNDHMSMSEAKEWAAEVYPSIEDAEGTVDETGNYVFVKRAGEKGI